MTIVFETEPCTRCNGTGQHSFNGEHSRCYKCDGKNGFRALTKRGVAARDYFRTLVEKAADDLVVGDNLILKAGLLTIVSFGEEFTGVTCAGVRITRRVAVLTNGQEIPLRKEKYSTTDQAGWDAAMALAVVYQGTLTKSGKPRKQ